MAWLKVSSCDPLMVGFLFFTVESSRVIQVFRIEKFEFKVTISGNMNGDVVLAIRIDLRKRMH